MTEKEVLASIDRLRGASSGEVAADLGVAQAEVADAVKKLAEEGYVKLFGSGQAIAASGRRRVSIEEAKEGVFDLTTLGNLELRS